MIVQAFVKKQECGLENNYFSGGSAILYGFVVVVLFVTIVLLVYI